MRTLGFCMGFFFLFTLAQAQEAKRARPLVTGPVISLSQAEMRPIELERAEIHVLISGDLAETTSVLTFRNPNGRVLEGELTFPLPEGATVSGFGLDVNGTLVDGVPVEKRKARITFEKEVRKGIDPGLMEHVGGNNYRARIYPIPANGTRTIKVQYVSELFVTPQGMNYRLPLRWGAVKQLGLTVEVVGPEGAPVVNGIGTVAPTRVGNRLVYQKTFEETEFEDDLSVLEPGLPRQRVCVESRGGEDADAGCYFLVSDLAELPPTRILTNAPRHIAILWDASLSRQGADLGRELAVLRRYLRTLDGVRVDVTCFSNRARAAQQFTVSGGDAAAILKCLKDAPLDGATDLGDLAVPGDVDFCLLFSDGMGNLGAAMPGKLPVPVYAVCSDARANHAVLSTIAARSGGAYLNLGRMDDNEAVAAIGHPPVLLRSVEVVEGAVAEMTPRDPQPAIGRVFVAGRLLSESATLKLNYGMGKSTLGSSTVVVRRADAAPGTLISRAWAQRRIAELSGDEKGNRAAMLSLGRRFGIVTPGTSLLVLENLQQYLAYQITPPKSRPEIYAAYMKQIDERKRKDDVFKAEKLERVVKMWSERVAWWERDYKYAEGFRYKAPAAKPGERSDDSFIIRGPGRTVGVRGTTAGEATVAEGRSRFDAGGVAAADALPAPAARARGGAGTGAAEPAASARPASPSASFAREMKAEAGGEEGGASISIKPWDPKTPYLADLKSAAPAEAYERYLRLRARYASPAFYLDCANFFLKNKQREIAVRILSNVAELELESAPLLRVAGYRLMQAGENDLAIDLFEKVLKLRPDEPQSYRDLALALIARGDGRRAYNSSVMADYQRALGLLHHVVMHDWDRFEGIEVIALMEANRLWQRMDQLPRGREIANPFDPRLVKLLDCRVRIVLSWDSDLTDMDLWVTEPSGEKCFYSHSRTTIGGMISTDFTQGYGPEEYCLRNGMKGTYTIQANFFGSHQQSLSGPTTLQAEVITDFGRPTEKRQSITVRLETAREVVDIGSVEVK